MSNEVYRYYGKTISTQCVPMDVVVPLPVQFAHHSTVNTSFHRENENTIKISGEAHKCTTCVLLTSVSAETDSPSCSCVYPLPSLGDIVLPVEETHRWASLLTHVQKELHCGVTK